MAETQLVEAEVRRLRGIAKALAVSVLAGLMLAACKEGAPLGTPGSQTTSPSFSIASATPTSSARVPGTSESSKTKAEGLAGCAPYFDVSKYTNHEYEVCVAYISNAATIALGGLYKYGNSRISYISDAAKHHFETRYYGQPRQTALQEVSTWPKTNDLTGNDIDRSITLVALSSSLKADRALLQTQESWQITEADGGAVLYKEPLHTRNITMCRGSLPGHPLHEWMVVSNEWLPDFDCRGFDTAHGIQP